ncbi:hypothetical protein CISIN_1g038423mg, partial [Citrus sinensis]
MIASLLIVKRCHSCLPFLKQKRAWLWNLHRIDNSMILWTNKTENYRSIEAFLRNYGSIGPKRYSYADIKKVTNSFNHELGQGGYGG